MINGQWSPVDLSDCTALIGSLPIVAVSISVSLNVSSEDPSQLLEQAVCDCVYVCVCACVHMCVCVCLLCKCMHKHMYFTVYDC